jgi:hypothetical protein
MKKNLIILILLALSHPFAVAQVPQLINYQGRVVVGTTNFTGAGRFKFALVNTDGTDTYWSNDGTSVAGKEPAEAVPLDVVSGLFSLRLGDASLAGMTPVPASVFANGDVRLRVWFSDGATGFEQFTPDQRYGSAPYAFRAGSADTVADGAVTTDKIAAGAVTAEKLAPGSITADRLNFTGTPNLGQVLGFDGANLTWITPAGGGAAGGSFTLPYSSGPIDNNGALFSVNNFGITDGWAIYGHSQNNLGVFGQTHGNSQSGVLGRNDGDTGVDGAGVFGYASTAAHGILGISEQGDGVRAVTNGKGKHAIYAQTSQLTSVAGHFVHLGLRNSANDPAPSALTADVGGDGWGVFSRSVSGLGVFGQTTDGGSGVLGRNEGPSGHAVHGYSSAGASGVRGDSVGADGVIGNTTAANKSGVVGFASNPSANGVAGINAQGTGVFGQTGAAGGTAAFFWNTAGGDAIRTTGNVNVGGTTTTKILTITGGADVAEPFIIGGGEIPKGSVVVIDERNPGNLIQSTRAYDTRVAGIVSGANGVNPGIALHQQGVLEGGQHVSLSGRVYAIADASGGAIKPGDLLTTSSTPGHAMRVSDSSRAQGAVLGKAMTPLSAGTGYVLVLVTLQ